MALSNDLISQFVKATQDKEETKKESTAYGKIVKQGDVEYVQLDGSDLLTPITSTTVVKDGDRVIVTIKNHNAVVTGDLTNPSASDKDVQEIGNKIDEFEIVIADKVTTEQLETEIARIEKLRTEELEATNAKIETLETKVAKVDEFEAEVAKIEEMEVKVAKIETLESDITTFKNTTTENLEATNATVHNLESDYASFKETTTNKITAHDGEFNNIRSEVAELEEVTAGRIDAVEGHFDTLESDYGAFKEATTDTLTANQGSITELETKKLDAESAKILYANIDFSNIKEAAIEKLFTDSGIIKDLIMSEGKVTGELVGVTIKGDLIEGNTLKADKLVILGTDGLYYKLNVNALGEATASSDEKYQTGLDGSVIVAESITAEKISVNDLVAFGATIGGFKITNTSIHSGLKDSVNNASAGIYQDKDGQFSVGDNVNFVKFYKNQNGTYKLEIAADSILFGSEKQSIESLYEAVNNNSEDLTAYMEATNKELESMQGQIDGSIMTWFYEYVPTNTNKPASDWNTTDLKNNHLGDLFYDTITGYCYRWQVQNNQYSWNRITDVDVTKALADAKNAQDTADNKRRVFVDTPTTPYDVGDLWSQGASGDLMRCKTAKTKDQSYSATDWVKASKYTDDTAVNQLGVRVSAAETAIESNAEAIELRATKTEVQAVATTADTAKNTATSVQQDLSNNYYNKTQTDAKIKVESDRITSTVSKVETIEGVANEAKSKADELEDEITPIAITEENKEFYLTDSADANCKTVEIFGESTQETRSGKNKLPNIEDITREFFGVTVSAVNNEISVVGTATNGGGRLNALLYFSLPAGSYKLGLTKNITSMLHLSNTSTGTSIVGTRGSYTEFTLVEETQLTLGVNVATDGVYDEKFKAMIVPNNITDYTYEQYGQMPSPEFPSEIESVGKLRNYLHHSATSANVKGIDYTVLEDGTITVKGTATAKSYFNLLPEGAENYVIPAGTYTLSGCPEGGSTSTYVLDINFNSVYYADYGSGVTITLTEDTQIRYCRMIVVAGQTVDLVFKPQLQLGTEIKPFSKDGKFIEYKSIGKNFWNKESIVTDIASGSYEITDTSFKFTRGTLTGGKYACVRLNVKAGKTYTFSALKTYEGSTTYLYLYKNAVYGTTLKNTTGNYITYTPVEDMTIVFTLIIGSTVTSAQFDDIQIEESDTVTKCEPYKENITAIPVLHDMGSLFKKNSTVKIRDSIYKENEKWYDIQKINYLTLDGTENWKFSSAGTNSFSAPTPINQIICKNAPGICNYYKTFNNADQIQTMNGIFLSYTSSIIITDLECNTIEAFKAKLARLYSEGKPVKVVYEMQNYITTEITDSETIAALENIRTFKNITHITADAPSILTYYRDIPMIDGFETKTNAETNYRINQEAANNANTAAEQAQTTANNNTTAITEAHSTIQQLSNMIANLVTDGNGGSLMTQTADGWTFNMSSITGNLTAIQDAMKNMESNSSETNNALQKLTDLVNSVATKTAYINLSTDDNGDPCIELGKVGNLFKVRITNTAIDFLEGSSKIAYANNNTFYSGKIITRLLQVGEGPGFAWETRANGNCGLSWIEG